MVSQKIFREMSGSKLDWNSSVPSESRVTLHACDKALQQGCGREARTDREHGQKRLLGEMQRALGAGLGAATVGAQDGRQVAIGQRAQHAVPLPLGPRAQLQQVQASLCPAPAGSAVPGHAHPATRSSRRAQAAADPGLVGALGAGLQQRTGLVAFLQGFRCLNLYILGCLPRYGPMPLDGNI